MIDVIDKLKRLGDLNAVYQKHVFECHRRAKDGSDQVVTVVILDGGPNVESGLRYHVSATTPDGRGASGNGNASLDAALATVHWGSLDSPPTRKGA